MVDILLEHIGMKVQLQPGEKELLGGFFTPRKLRRKQFLLHEGEVCRFMSFVTLGLLKSYHTDEKGVEHINQFAPEGWWISDMNSFFNSESSVFTIEAVEETQVLQVSCANLEELTARIPAMEKYFRLLFQKSLITKDRRIAGSLSKSAEEKYRDLLRYEPTLVTRIPQNLLASYLGLSPETVSRLKKNVLGSSR